MGHLPAFNFQCNAQNVNLQEMLEDDLELMMTVKRDAELRPLNSSSSFKPPRCTEKSKGLPAMYLIANVVFDVMMILSVLPGEIGRLHLVFRDNALEGDCVSRLRCQRSWSQNRGLLLTSV